MASIEGLGPNPTKEELGDELVFTRILVESLDPDAFDYEDLMERYATKIEQIEQRLGIEGGGGAAPHSQMALQESWHSIQTPPGTNGYLEDMLSPVASFNAMNGADVPGATGE